MIKKLSRILTGTLSLVLAGQIMFYGNETHNTISYAETVEEVSDETLSKETSEYIDQYGEYIGDTSNGNNVKIADPVAGCSAIGWSSGVSATYSITAEKCQAFIAPRGMLW